MLSEKGQHIVEYSILIALIISALVIMQVYIKRAYQGRLKQEAEEVGQQYSPRHTNAVTTTSIRSNSTTCTGGNCFGQDIDSGMTVTVGNTTTNVTKREGVDSFATED